MKKNYYIYNNEAIASSTILLVLQKVQYMEISKLCLVLPFLLDDRIVSLLQKKKCRQMSIEDIINNNRRIFSLFNRRYLTLLPVFINSIILLSSGNLITFQKDLVILKNKNINVNISDYGNRLLKIDKTVSFLLDLMIDKQIADLYRRLNIQL